MDIQKFEKIYTLVLSRKEQVKELNILNTKIIYLQL